MAKTKSEYAKHEVLDRTFDTLLDLQNQLDDERDLLSRLRYEEQIVSELASDSPTHDELDEWEFEKRIIDDMQAISMQEMRAIEDEIEKNKKVIDAITRDMRRQRVK